MNKSEAERILDYLKRIDESINGSRPKDRPPKDHRPLSERMDSVEKKVDSLDKKVDGLDKKVEKLDTRVSEVQLGLSTLAASTTAQFQKVDLQFKRLDRKIDKWGGDLVEHMERIHSELTGRIVDLEAPGTGGGGGGGRGSGGGGMPLAS